MWIYTFLNEPGLNRPDSITDTIDKIAGEAATSKVAIAQHVIDSILSNDPDLADADLIR
jgi:hypothetical protein